MHLIKKIIEVLHFDRILLALMMFCMSIQHLCALNTISLFLFFLYCSQHVNCVIFTSFFARFFFCLNLEVWHWPIVGEEGNQRKYLERIAVVLCFICNLLLNRAIFTPNFYCGWSYQKKKKTPNWVIIIIVYYKYR